jgi:hypothetical protein
MTVCSLAVPSASCNGRSFCNAVRDKGFLDVKSFDELLPGRPVKCEDGLVFLYALLARFLYRVGFGRY